MEQNIGLLTIVISLFSGLYNPVWASQSDKQAVLSCDINGIWQHADKDAALDINLAKGTISVNRHATNKSAVGQVVLKELKHIHTGKWSGQMYAAATDGYVGVDITSSDCQSLTVTHQGQTILTLLRTK